MSLGFNSSLNNISFSLTPAFMNSVSQKKIISSGTATTDVRLPQPSLELITVARCCIVLFDLEDHIVGEDCTSPFAL